MPVDDEEETPANAVARVLAVEYPCEIELVLVEDGGRDGTREGLAGLSGVTVVALRVVLAAQRPRDVTRRLRPLLVSSVAAGRTTLLTGGPFLAVQIFGPQRVSEAVSAPDRIALTRPRSSCPARPRSSTTSTSTAS